MTEGELVSTPAVPQKRPSRLFGQYIVKHRFQFKFSAVIFFFLGVAAATIWLEGKYAVEHFIASGAVSNTDTILQLKLISKITGQTSLLALAIVFGLSLFFSHFVAGPIYRFERTLEEIRGGNIAMVVRVRKHDEFKEVADLFNQALTSLRHRVQKERDTVNGALDKVKELADKMRQEGRVAEATALEQVIFEVRNAPPQIKI